MLPQKRMCQNFKNIPFAKGKGNFFVCWCWCTWPSSTDNSFAILVLVAVLSGWISLWLVNFSSSFSVPARIRFARLSYATHRPVPLTAPSAAFQMGKLIKLQALSSLSQWRDAALYLIIQSAEHHFHRARKTLKDSISHLEKNHLFTKKKKNLHAISGDFYSGKMNNIKIVKCCGNKIYAYKSFFLALILKQQSLWEAF